METITSRSNEKIKLAVRLGGDSALRKKEGLFLLEGARLCRDAAEQGLSISKAFITEQAAKKYSAFLDPVLQNSEECYIINDSVSERLSDTHSPQGIFCLCRIPERDTSSSLNPAGKYIALENIQDPSNLGSVCRCAEALGISGLILSGGCDIYNRKALRAAMGSSLRIPVFETDNLPALLLFAKENGILTLASVPDSGAVDIRTLKKERGCVCVIGNEGNGITPEAFSSCETAVTIPMLGKTQSLNAAAAAAIIMWELSK